MQFFVTVLSAALLAMGVSAQSASVTTTITISGGCPSPVSKADIVTRAPVSMPSCSDGAKASVMVSGSANSTMMSFTATPTSTGLPQFTGAANALNVAKGAVAAVGGVAAAVLFL